MDVTETPVATRLKCYHCGDTCSKELVTFDNKSFCCQGCRLVFELLSDNNLCTYYNLNTAPGVSPGKHTAQYAHLDHPDISNKLVHFRHNNNAHVTFYAPKMHCSSCIWLLEHLHKLNQAVITSSVDFLKKEITIVYKENETKLSELAGLLARLGYEPLITLNDIEKRHSAKDYSAIIKIGIAGFCFGNIMMLSFPEYFSVGEFYDQENLKPFFGYINIALSLPVLLYCASGFFTSAWKSIVEKQLNIDAPIALAIAVTFLRSIFEIVSGTGAGYLDSMSGIVFFMLLGRYFQSATYQTLSFERDYRSYFPVAVTVKDGNEEKSVPVNQLRNGHEVIIRSNELIPADSILVSDSTHIDYSFVTGESAPVKKLKGELIYAGALQLDGAIILRVEKEVSQSYLTGLWNSDQKSEQQKQSHLTFVDAANRYFTIAVLITAAFAFFFWMFTDIHRAINAFTAILIVACPCGLLLASTFCNAGMLRIFGRAGLYLKNAAIIESLAGIQVIVFDKTGTITHGSEVTFKGTLLKEEELAMAAALCAQSSHPLSRRISAHYHADRNTVVTHFEEVKGMGLKGWVKGHYLVMGSPVFVNGIPFNSDDPGSKVFLAMDGKPCGYFRISHAYRDGLDGIIKGLRKKYDLHLLSGDHDGEGKKLAPLFREMHFNQSPSDKLEYIEALRQQGKKVLMIGDGLNDAGALKHSDVGIAVSDDTNNFSPACDAILDGDSLRYMDALISYAKAGKKIIALTFFISLAYNITGLFFAIQGALSPVIAAILMPLSSITIVLLTTLSARWYGRALAH